MLEETSAKTTTNLLYFLPNLHTLKLCCIKKKIYNALVCLVQVHMDVTPSRLTLFSSTQEMESNLSVADKRYL